MPESMTATAAGAAIVIEGVEKRRGTRPVLAGVTATIAEGETVALVGASGCGKTTLLRCLNGLESFDAGAIDIAGFRLRPGTALPHKELTALRGSVGFVFQEHHLFAHLTAIENVALAPRVVQGESRDAAHARALELLGRVGLGDHVGAYPHELSGGQKQRVAIARALGQRPRVLLLDEPTSALDPETAEGVADTITELTRGTVTVVLVTHQADLAERMAQRVLRLESGRIVGRDARSPSSSARA